MKAALPELPIASVATLHMAATYLAPSGRLCRLVPQPGRRGVGAAGESFLFEYLSAQPGRHGGVSAVLEGDGFRFTAANVALLREVRR